MEMFYKPIPTIAQGERLASDTPRATKNNCYYFLSFEKTLNMLRYGSEKNPADKTTYKPRTKTE